MRSVISGLLNRSPVPLTSDRLFSPVRSSAESRMAKHLGAMEAQSTLFAIVDRIASSVAAAQWRLYRRSRPGGERVEVDTHPALALWRKPNPHTTGPEFVETVQQHYELVGEQWWTLARAEQMGGGGPPIEIWPVRPDRMSPVPDPREFIAGFTYHHANRDIPLKREDVIFVRRPNPLTPYRGIGPVGTLLVDIEGEQAASQFNTLFFRQGAEPGGIIEIDESLEDAEFEQMSQRWAAQHQGVANAHRVAVLERGKWKDRRYTQRDMQFEQLRRFSRETFRQAWGFPKPLLGDVEDVNRANAEAAEVVFARWLIEPRLRRLRTALNDDLLPQFGPSLSRGYEFDFDPVVPPNAAELRADQRARSLSAKEFVLAGMDPDGTLEAFGLPEIGYLGPPKERFLREPDGDE